MERQTITAKEAASYLGISYWLILEKAKRNEIPHIKVGTRVLFRKETLETWMNDQENNVIPSSNDKTGSLRRVDE